MLFSKMLESVNMQDQIQIVKDAEVEGWGTLNTLLKWSAFTYLIDIEYVAEVRPEIFKLIMTTEDIFSRLKNLNVGIALCQDPKTLFYKMHNALYDYANLRISYEKSRIAPSAQVNDLAYIAPYGVEIGEDCVIEPFVTIQSGTRIGNDTRIQSGTQIGGRGFDYKKWEGGVQGIHHYGGVSIGSHVDIHNNCCIPRGVFLGQDTRIGDYAKIDDLCHIAHGDQIGEGVIVAAGTTMGGSTVVKADTWIGLGSVLKNSIVVGEGVMVGMGSVLGHNVEDRNFVLGNPARRLK